MHFYSVAVNPEFRDHLHRVAVASERDNDYTFCPRTTEFPTECVPGSHIVNNENANRLGFSRPARDQANVEERTPHKQKLPNSVYHGPTCPSSALDASMPNMRNTRLHSDKVQVQDLALPSPPPTAVPFSLLSRASSHASASHGTPPVSPSPIELLPGTVALPFSLNNKIALSICGQVITYNLDELEDDPRTIIGLLKLISSERGNWMIVAAHYRRNKNPTAALAVVTAMLQVMQQHGVQEDDLKPAFLMLSGCETDLMKMSRSTDAVASEQHFKRSKEWLQKVYGKYVSAVSTGKNPMATQKPTCPIRGRSFSTKPHLTPPVSQHNISAATSATEGSTADQVRSLQRELQSLREYQRRQDSLLNRTNSDKRKLDEDLARLHVTRRKLERQVDGLQEQLSKAQRSENRLRDQLQREMMLRRRAEGEVARRRGSDAFHIEQDVPKYPTDATMAI